MDYNNKKCQINVIKIKNSSLLARFLINKNLECNSLIFENFFK